MSYFSFVTHSPFLFFFVILLCIPFFLTIGNHSLFTPFLLCLAFHLPFPLNFFSVSTSLPHASFVYPYASPFTYFLFPSFKLPKHIYFSLLYPSLSISLSLPSTISYPSTSLLPHPFHILLRLLFFISPPPIFLISFLHSSRNASPSPLLLLFLIPFLHPCIISSPLSVPSLISPYIPFFYSHFTPRFPCATHQ